MLPFDQNERIIYQVHKHWFVMFYPTLLSLLLALAPAGVYFAFSIYVPSVTDVLHEYIMMLVFLWMVWIVIWWMFWFLQWTDYYLDVWYVTNKRIVDVEQRGIFHRIVSTLRYEKIQDITFEVNGLAQVLIGFGDVHVQTAGEEQEIIIRHARNPEGVKRSIVAELDRTFEE